VRSQSGDEVRLQLKAAGIMEDDLRPLLIPEPAAEGLSDRGSTDSMDCKTKR